MVRTSPKAKRQVYVAKDTPGKGPFDIIRRVEGSRPHALLKGGYRVPADLVGPDQKAVTVTEWDHPSTGWWAKKVKKV